MGLFQKLFGKDKPEAKNGKNNGLNEDKTADTEQILSNICKECGKIFTPDPKTENDDMCIYCYVKEKNKCLTSALDIYSVDVDKIDGVIAHWEKQNEKRLPDGAINEIKKEINKAVEFIKTNIDGSMYFYFSEYPMGAEHSKGIIFSKGEWFLFRNDYDKKPPYRSIKLSNDDFIEAFINMI